MKRLLIAALLAPLCGVFLCPPAMAQKTKAQLNTEVSTTFPDNTIGAITPSAVRTFQNDVINSIMPTAPVVSGNLACFNGTTGLLQDCGSAPSSLALTVGTTVVAGGASGNILYDNAGRLGEYTATQLTAVINLATASNAGTIPAWPNDASKYFRGDGTYAALANLPLSILTPGTQDTVVGYWGSTTASALAIANCTNALTYSTSTHDFGCNTIAGTGTVSEAKFTASSGVTLSGNCDITTTNAGSPCNIAPTGTVATGYTGITNLTGFISGLQPLKLGGATIGVNPGTWASNTGTSTFNSTAVLTADLQTAAPSFASTPAVGGQISGALTATGNTTDGTEVFLYLIHRVSDNKVALVGSSSDAQGTSQTFTATAAAPGVITVGSAHGLRKRMAVYVSNSGGALPSPLAAATQYYVCTVPSTTTFTVATSIANANAGTCLTTTTTGSGTNTASWGVQKDLDFQLGAGIATMDRRLPYFAFVWSWTKYGSSGVPGGTNGIPDFQVAQGASDTLITNGGQATAFTVLSAGTAGSWTALDLSPWLANLNRRVQVFTYCIYPVTAGGCFMRATGSGGPGIQIGAPNTATIANTGLWTFQTDSTGHVDYEVTGGAQLSVYIMGWTFVDPS